MALTREVSRSIDRCEITHIGREPIDFELARFQHGRYENLLSRLGCSIHRLPPKPDLPDAVFVEDTAVILDEVAVLARPGAKSRRSETDSVAEALKRYRRVCRITPPATLDGGDVLRVGKTVYAGLSSRTNQAAVGELGQMLEPLGYVVRGVSVRGCLHLKSAVTQVSASALLMNGDWVDPGEFQGMDVVNVDPQEPLGANALLVNDVVVYPSGFPATKKRLDARGIRVEIIDVSELQKAEGGVTCCSLIFRA